MTKQSINQPIDLILLITKWFDELIKKRLQIFRTIKSIYLWNRWLVNAGLYKRFALK